MTMYYISVQCILHCYLLITVRNCDEPGSSVSIVSDYGLYDWVIEVRSPAVAKGFSCSLCIQTGYGAHQASSTEGTGGSFPRDKPRPGRDSDHSPPSSDDLNE
jgi:hypothetical protein